MCHPGTLCAAVRSLQATLAIRPNGDLHLCYQLKADLTRILIPEPTLPQMTDGLWQHTCFEAFITADNGSGYHEFNFSPSGQWAAYAFDGYRSRRPWTAQQSPNIQVERTDTRFKLEADIAASDLPPNASRLLYRLGLTAVIETVDKNLSYWALHHPGIKPDFHQPQGFVQSFSASG